MIITFEIDENENTSAIDAARAIIKYEEKTNADGLVTINRLLEIASHIQLYANHRLAIKNYNKE